jgi:hypothetical protein
MADNGSITDDGPWAPPSGDDRVQFTHDPRARQGGIGDQRQALPREIIHDRQNPEPATIGEGIADEVEAPARVCGLRHRHRPPGSQGPFASATLAHLQPLFAV